MTYDLVVIGGGPAGYEGAIRAAQLGAHVALVEKERLGGTCLNRGCIPTKAYYQHARILHELRRSREFGIEAGTPVQDPAAMAARKDGVVDRLAGGISRLLADYGIQHVTGKARIAGPGVVEAVCDSGETLRLEAGNILIATGSAPSLPPVPGMDLPGVLTSDSIWDLREIPERLVILGGGVIGLEFAGIYSNLGSHVTILEWMPRILPGMERDIAQRMTLAFRRSGVAIETGFEAKEIRLEGDGMVVDGNSKAGAVSFEGDLVLVATGRKPVLQDLGLEENAIAHDGKGIRVDEQYRTSAPGIWAAGDAIGGVMLAHVAAEEGKAAAERMFAPGTARETAGAAATGGSGGPDGFINHDAIPSCIFAFPEAASVGLTEEEAASRGIPVSTGKFLLGANGKAMAMGEEEGFVKVVAEQGTGVLLGVHLFGPHSSDLIHEGALAVTNRMTIRQVAETVHAHPTLAEAFYEAVLSLEGRAIHQSPPRKK